MDLEKIHKALHSDASSLVIDNKTYFISTNKTGCRYITINGIKYITQNISQNSEWGIKARLGHKITWGIRKGPWIRIVNNNIEIN